MSLRDYHPSAACCVPQPGNRAEVNARYSDVTELDFGVEPSLSTAVINVYWRRVRTQHELVRRMNS